LVPFVRQKESKNNAVENSQFVSYSAYVSIPVYSFVAWDIINTPFEPYHAKSANLFNITIIYIRQWFEYVDSIFILQLEHDYLLTKLLISVDIHAKFNDIDTIWIGNLRQDYNDLNTLILFWFCKWNMIIYQVTNFAWFPYQIQFYRCHLN